MSDIDVEYIIREVIRRLMAMGSAADFFGGATFVDDFLLDVLPAIAFTPGPRFANCLMPDCLC